MKEKLKDLLLNLCVAADVGLIGFFSLTPFWWWEYSMFRVLEELIFWVMIVFAVITVIRWIYPIMVRRIMRELPKKIEIKYDTRGQEPDGVRLGYISSETICEIARKERRE